MAQSQVPPSIEPRNALVDLVVVDDPHAALVDEVVEGRRETGAQRAVGQQDRRRHRRDNTAVPDLRSGYERINGADLYYEVSGSGPPVVLLHGGLCHLRQWDDLVEPLSRDHRVMSYDRRGHGRSSFPDVPYSHAADLAGLRDALDLRSTDLVAVSAGVGVAVEFAIAEPRSARRLVLGAGTMGGYRHTAEFSTGIGAILQAGARGDRGHAAELLAAFAPLRVAAALPEVWPKVRAMMIDDYSFAHSRDGAPKPIPMSPSAAERVAAVAAPTLVVVGDQEMDSMVEHARFLARGIPSARLAVIPNADHMVTFEQPAELARLVTEFLR